MRKIVLTFGFIAGGILSVMMALNLAFIDRFGFDKAEVLGYATMVAAFLVIYFGVRSYRDNVAGGHITFGRACTVGLLIMVLASACYVATWQVLYHKVWPDFGDRYAAHMIEKARAGGASQTEIAEQERKMAEFKDMYRKPLINIAFTFLEPLPVGLFFVLVSAGVVRRRAEETELGP